MIYLTDADFLAVISAKDFTISFEGQQDIIDNAEQNCIDFVSSYLAGQYRTDFWTDEDIAKDRGLTIAMVDIILFNLTTRLPERMGGEIRRLRYEDALKFLNNVQKGIVSLTIPRVDTTTTDYFIQAGSNPKHDNFF